MSSNAPILLSSTSKAREVVQPSLLTLPPEIGSSVFGYLPRRPDLNKLAQTCKALHSLVTPKIYNHVIIRVPMSWSRLPSLENLIGSDSAGLKYTTRLSVEVQQEPLHPNQCENSEDSSDSDSSVAPNVPDSRMIYLPRKKASKDLNVLIRLLISRIPRNRLQAFRWNHTCVIDLATLTSLQYQQHASLHELCLVGIVSRSSSYPATIRGLDTICISAIPSSEGLDWPYDLMFDNRESLRQLQLGVETVVAQMYASRSFTFVDLDVTSNFRSYLKARSTGSEVDEPIFDLDLLWLYGIDLSHLVRVNKRPLVNFSSLTSLALESCPGMGDIFAHVKEHKMALKSFTLRCEFWHGGFSVDLVDFLRSFDGLKSLQILLEGGRYEAPQLSQILSIHGKTLKTLVWDERTGPRDTTAGSTTFLPWSRGYLAAIAAHCPGLTSLGISLNWRNITTEARHEAKVISFPYVSQPTIADEAKLGTYFSKLKKLETLNIRNLPLAESRKAAHSWLPLDFMYQSLANWFLGIVMKNSSSNHKLQIKTFALGALTYSDRHMGMSHPASSDPLRDFFRLRIYDVNYHRSVQGLWSPVLNQIAKGKPDDELSVSHNMDVFEHYWLG